MPGIRIAAAYNRQTAVARLARTYRRWFPPSPQERMADIADATELALRTLLPHCRVGVQIEPISGARAEGATR